MKYVVLFLCNVLLFVCVFDSDSVDEQTVVVLSLCFIVAKAECCTI